MAERFFGWQVVRAAFARGIGCCGPGVWPPALSAGRGPGNLLSFPPLIAQAEWPAAQVGAVVALVSAVNQGFCAFPPAVFGLLRDLGGDWTLGAAALALQLAAAAVLAGQHVRPGDIIVGDADGVVVIPLDRAPAVLERLQAIRAAEAKAIAAVEAGATGNDRIAAIVAAARIIGP